MAADNLTQLECSYYDVRQTSTPVLRDRIETSTKEIERVHETLEYRRNRDVRTYARVDEANELRTMLEQHQRQCASPTTQSVQIKIPSL